MKYFIGFIIGVIVISGVWAFLWGQNSISQQTKVFKAKELYTKCDASRARLLDDIHECDNLLGEYQLKQQTEYPELEGFKSLDCIYPVGCLERECPKCTNKELTCSGNYTIHNYILRGETTIECN